MKGLSHEIPVGKVDAFVTVENNIRIIVKRDDPYFPGVEDHRMLHIDMIQSTWEILFALYPEKVGLNQAIIKQDSLMQQEVGLLHSTEEIG